MSKLKKIVVVIFIMLIQSSLVGAGIFAVGLRNVDKGNERLVKIDALVGGQYMPDPTKTPNTEEQQEQAQKELRKFKSIIYSMTPRERHDPSIIKNSRKLRIAQGCGMTSYDVNRVLNKFEEMQTMMKRMKGMKGKFPVGNFPGGMGF